MVEISIYTDKMTGSDLKACKYTRMLIIVVDNLTIELEIPI